MPATTSPLMALRLSGRLMVIQNACPRFSRSTLFLSAISLSASSALTDINGRMAANCKRDLSFWIRRRRSLLDPDFVVVERRPTDRRHRLGAGERIDAAAADMGLVRLNRFRDQHAAAQAIEQFCGQRGLASDIAEGDGIAVGDRKLSRIGWMNH